MSLLGRLIEMAGTLRGESGRNKPDTRPQPVPIPAVPDTRAELAIARRQIDDARREAERARSASILAMRTRMMMHGANGVLDR